MELRVKPLGIKNAGRRKLSLFPSEGVKSGLWLRVLLAWLAWILLKKDNNRKDEEILQDSGLLAEHTFYHSSPRLTKVE
jgi:hypothetical protein